ncbi:XRE family transcriptional regulator [Actinopolyspora erythraea]|uniref:XRE family transcriptional regulator n=1 Tax=Actinopolyspora erythraea TaxID=414996 RepID=A0A223RVJ4_9ACTN|nr:helix-turn-helix transcriptional regulator [Actinopolyspora erythraea]ASU79906.1 XRE family transcriptional regulator [Actinopolyspora erythraea]
MGRVRQTLERRQLGLTLRRLREASQRTRQEAAATLGKVRSRIAELEEGRSTISPSDLEKLLDLYETSGEEREATLALAAEARKRQPKRPYTDVLPRAYQRFADLEANATEITSYEPGVVPGLLQSPDYIKAVMEEAAGTWWNSGGNELDQRVNFRLERQNRTLYSEPGKRLCFFVTEDSLRFTPKGEKTRREQALHILRLVDEQPDTTVRLLPRDAPNPARGGGFTVFDFGNDGAPVGFSSVVYGPSTYFDERSDIEVLRAVAQRLSLLTAAHETSLEFIESLAKEN